MKLFQVVIISFLILVNSITVAFCQEVTLSWDPSPTAEVIGYKVYYKQGNNNYPFDGTGAYEGNSPVDVGDTLTTVLTELDDGATYYFAVTAYDNDDHESSYSNIVSNSWTPALTAPTNNVDIDISENPVIFRWQPAPSGYDVTYTLYFSTDQSKVTAAGTMMTSPPSSGGKNIPPSVIALLVVLIIAGASYRFLQKTRFSTQAIDLLLVFLLGGMLTACGGGGGGGDSSSSHSASGSAPPTGGDLYTVPVGVETSYEPGVNDINELEELKTYYWKVVATDNQNSNLTYESEVRQFTTR